MSRPTDEEAAARRVLARKLGIAYAEHARTLESLASMNHPAIDDVRSEVVNVSDEADELLWKYDRDFGAPNERATTKHQLRMLNAKLCNNNESLSERALKYRAQLVGGVAHMEEALNIIHYLARRCQAHGDVVPPELMGEEK